MSKVWNYFVKCEDDRSLVTCKLCKSIVKRPLGNTTNLWKHYAKCSLKCIKDNGDGDSLPNSQQEIHDYKGRYAKRSLVWNFFTSEKNGLHAVCNSCRLLVKLPGGNTSNLWKHKRICDDMRGKGRNPPKAALSKPKLSKGRKVKVKTKANGSRRQSKVWNYFSVNPADKGSAICHTCKNAIKRPFGNTSNLWAHHRKCSAMGPSRQSILKSFNNFEGLDIETFPDIDSITNADKLSTTTSLVNNDTKEIIAENNALEHILSKPSDETCTNLVSNVKSEYSHGATGDDPNMECSDIVSYLIQDLPSGLSLNGVGFSNLMRKAYPNINISKKIIMNCLSAVKNGVELRMGETIRSAPSLSLSIQCFETQVDCLCLAIFVHFHDLHSNPYLLPSSSNCSKVEMMLGLRFYHSSMNADQLYSMICDTIEPYLTESSKRQQVCCAVQHSIHKEGRYLKVFDDVKPLNVLQSSNKWNVSHVTVQTNCLMKEAIECGKKIQGYQIVTCLLSQMKELVSNVVANHANTILGVSVQKAQDVCAYFQQTRSALIRLERIQVNLGRPQPLLLTTEVSSHCLQLYQILSRLLELKSEIGMLGETTDKICASLNKVDWEIYLSLVNLIQPVQKAMEKASQDASLANGIPIVVDLCTAVEKLKCENDNHEVDTFLFQLCECCCSLKCQLLNNDEYLTSTLLHPGLRCYIPSDMLKRISHFIAKTNLDDTVCADVSTTTFGKVTFQPNIKYQVEQYFKDSSSVSTNPMYYWTEYQAIWPDLAKLALKYLKVPLSVVQLDPDIFKSPAIRCLSLDTESYAQDVVFLRENLKRRSDLSSLKVQ